MHREFGCLPTYFTILFRATYKECHVSSLLFQSWVRPVARSGLRGCFLGESGLFACFPSESGLFLRIFGGKVDFYACVFMENMDFYCVVNAGQGHVPWENFEK